MPTKQTQTRPPPSASTSTNRGAASISFAPPVFLTSSILDLFLLLSFLLLFVSYFMKLFSKLRHKDPNTLFLRKYHHIKTDKSLSEDQRSANLKILVEKSQIAIKNQRKRSKLPNRNVVITGGSKGIGLALAREFLK